MSVGLALPSIFSVSGSPVTSSGTLTGTFTTQAANRIFAGPTTGADATPAFRVVVDDDIPNTITVDLAAIATVANSGDSATAFFSSGTIEDARIDSAIARLASPVFTGNPTAPTPSVGDNDTSVATTAFVANRIDDTAYNATTWNNDTNAPTKNAIRNKIESMGGGGGGDVYLANTQTFTGSNTFSGPVWFKPFSKRVVLWDIDFTVGNGVASASLALPWLQGAALASGTSAVTDSLTNNQGIVRLSSTTSANSGYYYHSSVSQLFAVPLLTFESITRVRSTNDGVRVQAGFSDSVSTAAPTDAIRLWRSNNFLLPQVYNNSSLTQGYEYPVGSNQVVRVKIQVQANMTEVSFSAYDSSDGTLILSTNITGLTLPATSSRLFGGGYVAYFTNNVAVALEELDWSTAYIDTPVNR